MFEQLKKSWNDPVWSKVISGLILAGLLPIIAAVWSSHNGLWPHLASRYLIPLWLISSLLIVTVCSVLICVTFMLLRGREEQPRAPDPRISKIDAVVSSGSPEKLTFPLKCHVVFRNESLVCVEVRVGSYQPKKVTLKRFVTNVLQVNAGKWYPEPEGVDHIAVLPRQLFRAWIGIDENVFNETRVKDLMGRMGILTLFIDGKRFEVEV